MAVDPVRAVGPLPRDPILRRALEVSPTDSFFVPFPPALARWQTTSPTDYTKFLAGSQYREGGLGGPFVVLPAGVPDNAAGKGRVEALVAALAAFLHPTRVEARFVRALSPVMLRMFPTSHSDEGYGCECRRKYRLSLRGAPGVVVHSCAGSKCRWSICLMQLRETCRAMQGLAFV